MPDMQDDLALRFERYCRGECDTEALEHELLTLSRESADRGWQALALLDQLYRRGRIADAICRRLRHSIGQLAIGLEGRWVEPEAQTPAPIPGADAIAPTASEKAIEVRAAVPAAPEPPPPAAPPTADTHSAISAERDSQTHRNQTFWQRGFQTSPALGLIAVMLGVAASSQSTQMEREPRQPPVAEAIATAPAAPAAADSREPEVISLSSDRYLVYPKQKALEFTVSRSNDGGSDASFVWWTQPSGAKSSADYIGTRRTLAAVPNGTASIKLRVPILANPLRRHIEMFYVVIGKADGGADIGAIQRAAVFIMPPGAD